MNIHIEKEENSSFSKNQLFRRFIMKHSHNFAVALISATVGAVSGFMVCAVCMKYTIDEVVKKITSDVDIDEEDGFYDMDPHIID